MYKKVVTYTDYNGNERNDEFYFHLNKAEMLELQLSKKGGFEAYLENIIKAEDVQELMKFFKELLLMSYGIKSEDGKRFIKTEELRNEFSQTEAFSELFVLLATDDQAAADFVNGIFPADQRLSEAELEKARVDAENRMKQIAKPEASIETPEQPVITENGVENKESQNPEA